MEFAKPQSFESGLSGLWNFQKEVCRLKYFLIYSNFFSLQLRRSHSVLKANTFFRLEKRTIFYMQQMKHEKIDTIRCPILFIHLSFPLECPQLSIHACFCSSFLPHWSSYPHSFPADFLRGCTLITQASTESWNSQSTHTPW